MEVRDKHLPKLDQILSCSAPMETILSYINVQDTSVRI